MEHQHQDTSSQGTQNQDAPHKDLPNKDNQTKDTREIEKLKARIAQNKALLAQKLAQQNQKQKQEARARETRRKILAGAIVLQRAQKDADFAARLFEIIGEDLTEERNRALFPEIGAN